MRFHLTTLSGAWLIDLQPIPDERGSFMRTFCEREFAAYNLETNFVQHSTSFSARRGTVRGMHFQRPPHEETKLVRCTGGRIWDVILDLRPSSPTFRRWEGLELSAEARNQLYIPKGFAHGFQTLSDDAEVHYLISTEYAPAAAAGVRHDDPAFPIDWPLPVAVISDKDRSWPDFRP